MEGPVMRNQWNWHESKSIAQIRAALQEGELVAGYSDTVIGLLAPLTPQGKEGLDRIKHRSEKPYIILVENRVKAAYFSAMIQQPALASLLDVCWPGPLTLIVPARATVPSYMVSPAGAIALRVPNHAGLQQLLAHCDGLFSTSANLTGHPIPDTIATIDPKIITHVKGIVEDSARMLCKPSTILDVTSLPARVVREGAYTAAFLKNYIALM
jgi:L-threonylcarbamoyladenylate synthase